MHCLVARNTEIVLAEYTEHDGNFQQISRLLLRKLRNEKKLTIEYDNYHFHYYKDEETRVSFLCLTEMLPFEIAYGFISDVRKEFYKKYQISRIRNSCSYQLQDFEETMKELVSYYNIKPSLTKSGESISSLNIVNHVEVRKIDTIFQADERINLVAVNTKIIKKNYQNLNYMDKKIKYQENYKKFKFGILFLVGCLISLLFIKFLISITTGDNQNSSKNSTLENNITNKIQSRNKSNLYNIEGNEYNTSNTNNNQEINKIRLLEQSLQLDNEKSNFISKENKFLNILS
jgi:hypothetical protein